LAFGQSLRGVSRSHSGIARLAARWPSDSLAGGSLLFIYDRVASATERVIEPGSLGSSMVIRPRWHSSDFVDHCLGVVFYPVIPKGAWVATTEFKLNLIKPVSAGICQATAQVLALAKRSGVARIDVVNDEQLVCAAQGTVTIVLPKTR
jgi:hypothetical protein